MIGGRGLGDEPGDGTGDGPGDGARLPHPISHTETFWTVISCSAKKWAAVVPFGAYSTVSTAAHNKGLDHHPINENIHSPPGAQPMERPTGLDDQQVHGCSRSTVLRCAGLVVDHEETQMWALTLTTTCRAPLIFAVGDISGASSAIPTDICPRPWSVVPIGMVISISMALPTVPGRFKGRI